MKISPGQNQALPLVASSAPENQTKIQRTATPKSGDVTEARATTGGNALAETVDRPTDVTLRRDTNGRVYYVVSDASSGKEILEVPPKALRDVSQGIADYLKQEESKAGAHVEVKA